MHEMSLMANFLKQIYETVQENKATRIVSLKIRIGAYSPISPKHFREHFAEAAKGGLAENAQLLVEIDPDEKSPLAPEIVLESIEVDT